MKLVMQKFGMKDKEEIQEFLPNLCICIVLFGQSTFHIDSGYTLVNDCSDTMLGADNLGFLSQYACQTLYNYKVCKEPQLLVQKFSP